MSTGTGRIRWEPGEHGSLLGYVGTFEPLLFDLWRHRVGWTLRTTLPGMPGKNISDGEVSPSPPVTTLKAEAEQWLERFVSSLGAIFPPHPEEETAK